MIRQAINCDMCGAERVESTSFWFVADEVKGEIRLRGWDVARKSNRHSRHLCGQKCVQRMMDNFTAAILAGQQAVRGTAKEMLQEATTIASVPTSTKPVAASADDLDEMPILERMGYDRATADEIEAESWAGPVRFKESATSPVAAQEKPANVERPAPVPEKGFIRANNFKPLRAFQRMA